MMSKSGKEIGQEYLARIRTYLEHTSSLPMLGDGSINISAIATSADVPRQSLYKNPSIRSLLDSAKVNFAASPRQEPDGTDNPAGSVPSGRESKQTKALERRVNQLEQQNAALVAENAELRRQLRAIRLQMGREDMALETGRRIPSPPATDA
jgi:hypothetical protein